MPDAPAVDAYVRKAGLLAERLAARDIGPADTPAALAAARNVAEVDVDAPTAGSPAASGVKRAVKRLTSWYVAYLAEQVNDLAFALVRVSETLDRRAQLAAQQLQRVDEHVAYLEQRLRAVESALGAARGPATASDATPTDDATR